MTMEDSLLERFGPLIPMVGLASLLDRSPEAARMFLRSNDDLARQLNCSKVRIGRRLFFRTSDVAEMLSGKGA